MEYTGKTKEALFEFLLYLGDDNLIHGHRLSEWCGHGPVLEEELAMGNIALDCLGQAQAFLELAAEVQGEGKSADYLAYFRSDIEYRNLNLLEQPNTDFAYSIVKQFLMDVLYVNVYELLSSSPFDNLAALAAKGLKEKKYHLRHSKEWMLRLGDGTEESHSRLQTALNNLWMYTNGFFEENKYAGHLVSEGIIPAGINIMEEWNKFTKEIIEKSSLTLPEPFEGYLPSGRLGYHTEHLGHLLSEMQILARSHPGAKW